MQPAPESTDEKFSEETVENAVCLIEKIIKTFSWEQVREDFTGEAATLGNDEENGGFPPGTDFDELFWVAASRLDDDGNRLEEPPPPFPRLLKEIQKAANDARNGPPERAKDHLDKAAELFRKSLRLDLDSMDQNRLFEQLRIAHGAWDQAFGLLKRRENAAGKEA